MGGTVRICLWPGPRNVSTALLYSFAQRADTRAVDEPFYAHYLLRSGAQHPGREAVLAAMDADLARVIRNVILGPCDRPVAFFKQMAHHLFGVEDRGFLRETVNVFLTRNPAQMLPSLAVQIPEPTLLDTGYAMQTELLDELLAAGQDPPVLESKELLTSPESVLRQLCEKTGIPWDPAMLSWPPGPKPEDGVWAPHWYHNVWRSTGFAPYKPKTEPFPERLKPLLEECRPHYEKLQARAIRAQP